MIQFKNKKVYEDNKLVDFNGLNNSHMVWHLQEMYKPERFINNLYNVYTMPDKINHMSLAEGIDFDALLVDDKLFRYTKLSEADRSEVQDYINKYAYATALLKLHECSKVIGCGLEHNFTVGESYTFISKSYDKLFENVYATKEQGKLVEGFGTDNRLNIYEGVKSYIHGLGDKRIVENWKCEYRHNDINKYMLNEAVQDGNNAIVTFTDKKGVQYEAIYENTNAKLLNGGVNLSRLLDRNNLVEAYRVSSLNEYKEPFTKSDATILSYGIANDKLQLVMLDAYGNKGTLYITLNIPVNKFLRKYKKDLEEITNSMSFADGVEDTITFLNKAEGDIASMSRIKGKEIVASDSESSSLPYQVKGLIPEANRDGETIIVDPKDKTKFKVLCTKNGEPYSITYNYIGENIYKDVSDLQNELDDYDFNSKADIINFFSTLNNYGRNPKTYKRGISTAGRNYPNRKKVEGDLVEEAEGVQTTDIAPKLDQEVGGLIKVTMKRKKKKVTESDDMFNISDLLIESVSEKDAFYGARGFIKDENGRYHFGDYYLTESGKVVHKSKLNEEFWNDEGETEENIVGTYEVYKNGNKCNIEVRQFNNDKSKMYAVDNPFKGFEWGTNFYKTKEAVKKFLSKHNAKKKLGEDTYSRYVDETHHNKINLTSDMVDFWTENEDELKNKYKVKKNGRPTEDLNAYPYKCTDDYLKFIKNEYNNSLNEDQDTDNYLKRLEEKRREILNSIPKDDKEEKELRRELYDLNYKINTIKLSKLNESDYTHKYRCVSASYETIKTFNTKEEAIEYAKNNSNVYSVVSDLYNDGKLVSVGMNDIWSKEDLNESIDSSIQLVLTNDDNINLAPGNIVTVEDDGKEGCEKYLRNLLRGSKSAEEVANRLNSNVFPNKGDKRIFGEWKPVSTEKNVTKNNYNAFTNKKSSTKYETLSIVDSYDSLKNHQILKVYVGGTPINESSYEEKKKEAITTAKDIMTKIANKVGNTDNGIYTTWRSKGYCMGTIELDNNTVRINVTYYFKKYMSDKGTINIEVAPNVKGYNVNRGCYVDLYYNSVEEAIKGAYEATTIARNIVKEKDIDKKNELVQQLKGMKNKLKESFDPTGYTKAIEAINAGIETDEDKEALQKYLQDLIGYIRSIAEDYDILVEGKEEANDVYYKVNDVTQTLLKIKPYIEKNEEANKLYGEIVRLLNDLQISLYKAKLNESFEPPADGIACNIDPVTYAMEVLPNHGGAKTEFDKLCVEYKNIFDTMCKYNTVACDIYPGFDKENAEKYLSPAEYKKFKKYDDLYQSERQKLRDVSDKIDLIPDDEIGETAYNYYKTTKSEKKSGPSLWDNPLAAYKSDSVK